MEGNEANLQKENEKYIPWPNNLFPGIYLRENSSQASKRRLRKMSYEGCVLNLEEMLLVIHLAKLVGIKKCEKTKQNVICKHNCSFVIWKHIYKMWHYVSSKDVYLQIINSKHVSIDF